MIKLFCDNNSKCVKLDFKNLSNFELCYKTSSIPSGTTEFVQFPSTKVFGNLQTTRIIINNNLNIGGGFGIIYDGKYDDCDCLIKISHDNIYSLTEYNVSITNLLYKDQFIKLSDKLRNELIIPKIFFFECLHNIDFLIKDTIKYDNKYIVDNTNINTFILCIEKYDIDLFELRKKKLMINNK